MVYAMSRQSILVKQRTENYVHAEFIKAVISRTTKYSVSQIPTGIGKTINRKLSRSVN
jgi:hypothetical protein